MANDRMYQQEYLCPSCGRIEKHYVWTSEIETKTHICSCGDVVGFAEVYDKPIVESPLLLRKMTKEQIKADRTKRSRKHFKEEVLPTLSGKDQRYFNSKHRNNKD